MKLSEEFVESEMPAVTNNFEPLPSGDYTAAITQAEVKPTADGSGEYIKLRLDITGPTHEGRVVFANLNTKNQSLKAEEIGRAQLGEIMRALGLPRLRDTDEMIGGQVGIKLTIRPSRTDEKTGRTYEASNEVRGYKSMNSTPPATFAKQKVESGKASPFIPDSDIPVKKFVFNKATNKMEAAPPWAKKS